MMEWLRGVLAWFGIGALPGSRGGRGYRTGEVAGEGEDRINFRRPSRFEDVEEVAELLRDDLPVVINLETAGLDDQRRIVDFLCGVTFALEGEVCRVTDGVFMFTPNRVAIDAPDAESRRFPPPVSLQPRAVGSQSGAA
jgi:SepF-like predicted cell division protein (DUF552 family)